MFTISFCILSLTLFHSQFQAYPQRVQDKICVVDDKVYKVGVTFPAPKGTCLRYTCKEDGNIHSVGCGLFFTPIFPSCYFTPENFEVQYPYCCSNLICPESYQR